MIAVALLMMAQAAPQPSPTVVNGSFEASDASGLPAGWKVSSRGSSAPEMTLTLVAGPHGRAVRITPVAAEQPGTARIGQVLDAAPWRGKIVRLSARVRVIDAGWHVGLRIAVQRPAPFARGFFSQTDERSMPAGEWRQVSVLGYVDEDATAIDGGAIALGGAVFEIDDVALVEVGANAAPASPDAVAYLDTALRFIRRRHMDAGKLDWTRIEARARAMIAGARTPADTYSAIRSVLGTLGDNHSHLIAPRPVRTQSQSPSTGGAKPGAPPPPMPSYALLEDRFGVLRLPGLMFTHAERWIGERYVAILQEGLRTLDAKPLCGWILDLRGNTGGNMWPMLNAIAPLLGPSPFGAFVLPDGKMQRWVLEQGDVTIEGAPRTRGRGAQGATPNTVRQAGLPLAMLIGPSTSSAGEATAIALIGRTGVRSFGASSGGYTSANESMRLADGGMLAVPSSWEADRTGKEYRDRLVPDEPGAAPLDAAKAWLAGQCRPR